MIGSYDDFIAALMQAGFSMGGRDEGIYAVVPWSWNEQPPYETSVRWHTGEPDTDPWEWRMRVLEERTDIAYAKLFFKKSGYITKTWYPYFWAVRRGGQTLSQAYQDGTVSREAKRIYDAFDSHETLALHEIKEQAGFGKTEKAAFDRALVELQMKMYLTMCGRQRKLSLQGEAYGWSSTVLCKTETFFGQEIVAEAMAMDKQQASERIAAQVYMLSPSASKRKVQRFMEG